MECLLTLCCYICKNTDSYSVDDHDAMPDDFCYGCFEGKRRIEMSYVLDGSIIIEEEFQDAKQ